MIEEFVAWAEARDGPGVVEGCSDEEVGAVLASQPVDRLPEDYLEFLRRAGRRAGGFSNASILFFPDVLEARDGLRLCWEENDRPFPFPDRSFVFAGHGGYTYTWFHDPAADPPIVTIWMEGEEPQQYFRTFGEWLAARMRIEDVTRGITNGEILARIDLPNPYPSYEELRTYWPERR